MLAASHDASASAMAPGLPASLASIALPVRSSASAGGSSASSASPGTAAAAAAAAAGAAAAEAKRNKKKMGPPRWDKNEDDQLRQVVESLQAQGLPEDDTFWAFVAEALPGREAAHCANRWRTMLDPALIKGAWTKEEDEIIIRLVGEYGPCNWTKIAEHLKGRIGKQCRERWHNTLNPDLRRGPWTEEEIRIIINAHATMGNKWAAIAKLLPGRTDNHIKNFWHGLCAKKANALRSAINQDPDAAAYDDDATPESKPAGGAARKASTSSSRRKSSKVSASDASLSPPPSSPSAVSAELSTGGHRRGSASQPQGKQRPAKKATKAAAAKDGKGAKAGSKGSAAKHNTSTPFGAPPHLSAFTPLISPGGAAGGGKARAGASQSGSMTTRTATGSLKPKRQFDLDEDEEDTEGGMRITARRRHDPLPDVSIDDEGVSASSAPASSDPDSAGAVFHRSAFRRLSADGDEVGHKRVKRSLIVPASNETPLPSSMPPPTFSGINFSFDVAQELGISDLHAVGMGTQVIAPSAAASVAAAAATVSGKAANMLHGFASPTEAAADSPSLYRQHHSLRTPVTHDSAFHRLAPPEATPSALLGASTTDDFDGHVEVARPTPRASSSSHDDSGFVDSDVTTIMPRTRHSPLKRPPANSDTFASPTTATLRRMAGLVGSSQAMAGAAMAASTGSSAASSAASGGSSDSDGVASPLAGLDMSMARTPMLPSPYFYSPKAFPGISAGLSFSPRGMFSPRNLHFSSPHNICLSPLQLNHTDADARVAAAHAPDEMLPKTPDQLKQALERLHNAEMAAKNKQ